MATFGCILNSFDEKKPEREKKRNVKSKETFSWKYLTFGSNICLGVDETRQ